MGVIKEAREKARREKFEPILKMISARIAEGKKPPKVIEMAMMMKLSNGSVSRALAQLTRDGVINRTWKGRVSIKRHPETKKSER
jgi:Mn-dependent DtxR family transcriptional regulator